MTSCGKPFFDLVGSIEIVGAKNEVTWMAGRDGGNPGLTDRGYGNQARQG